MLKKSIFAIFTSLATLSAWANDGAPMEHPEILTSPKCSEIWFPEDMPVRYEPAMKLTDNTQGLDTLDFRYCKEGESAMMTGDGGDVENSAAILLPEGIVSRMAGNKITSIWILTGMNKNNLSKNNVTDVTVWFRSSLDGANIQSQRGRLSRTALTWTEIVLNEPYVIKSDEPVYVGMTVVRPTTDDYVFVNDRQKNDQGCSFFVNYALNGYRQWYDWSNEFGSLCMRLTMVGNNIPDNDVFVSSFKCPSQVPYGKKFEATFTVTNHGRTPVKKITLETTVGDSKPVTSTLSFPSPITNYNASMTVTMTATCTTYGTQVPVKVRVTKVNDVEDTYMDDNSLSAQMLCLDESKGYQRTFVMEEGTGTWCGFCPRGAAAISMMQRLHPDTFIGIAAHYNDPMQISKISYNEKGEEVKELDYDHGYGKMFAMMSGYPHARFCRNATYGYEIPSSPAGVGDMYDHYMQLPAIAKIDMDVYFTDASKTELNVETVSEFAFDTNTDYRITCVLLENGVGPYPQTNNYSGVGYDMEGWESLPGTAVVTYDHVARYVDNYYGVPSSLPYTKKAATPLPYNAKIPTSSLKSLNDFSVVAMILNQKTGEIENAVVKHCDSTLPVKDWTNAIEEVNATDAQPVTEWYTIQGVKVASPDLPGIYIKVTGTHSSKVLVK